MKNFCFDLYGTLLDIRTDEESDEFWGKIAALLKGKQDGRAVKSLYRELCREEKERQQRQEIELLSVFERMSEQADVENAAAFATAFRRASVVRCRPFAGVAEMLARLRERGANLYLLSNAQACFTRTELAESGLDKYFHGILLSSEAGWKKPDPHFFGQAISMFKLDPAQSVYIGNDLRDDVGGAGAAGMMTVYIQTEQSGVYENPPAPDLEVANVEELSAVLITLLTQ